MRKVVLILFLLVLMGAAGFSMLRKPKSTLAEPAKEAPPVAVELTSPGRETLRRAVQVFGSLSPKTSTDVKSELPGRVASVRVKEWDQVRPGETLLEMDPTDYRLELNRYEAGLRMAKAQLLQARVDLNRAKREWNRSMKLKEGGLITGRDVDEQQSALESAEARVALAEAQVGQAEAQMREARHLLEKTRVSSSIQGTVSERKVDVGDWVDKGARLFVVVDNRILDFTATVAATDLGMVHEGQRLTFTVDGLPDQQFQGVIKRVNPLVSSADRSGKVLAEVRNPEGVLRGGLYARGQVLVEERPDALVLPKATLMNWDLQKGAARVFVVDESGTARARDLATGLADGDRVEILSGLSPSDRVVLRGGFNVREGDRVHEAVPEARSGGEGGS